MHDDGALQVSKDFFKLQSWAEVHSALIIHKDTGTARLYFEGCSAVDLFARLCAGKMLRDSTPQTKIARPEAGRCMGARLAANADLKNDDHSCRRVLEFGIPIVSCGLGMQFQTSTACPYGYGWSEFHLLLQAELNAIWEE
eukprot:4872373-Amphidinium_carterae.1